MIETVTEEQLHVLDGVDTSQGRPNTSDETVVAHVEHSIRLGYPQVRPQPPQADRVCLVGGGPSLADTFDELRALYFAGAKVVTVNGSYAWCLDHNIRPSAQIVLDARAENARFLNPAVPQCKYLVASQCHPDTWRQVEGRPDVYIWHGAALDNPHLTPILNAYYAGRWTSTPGGTTVIVRAILLLRILGFLRFDLFGVDSCVMGGQHHAYAQPENDADGARPVTISRRGEQARVFSCAGWHLKALECMLQTIRLHGHNFLLNVHGDGLIAYALRLGADAQWTVDDGTKEA